MPSVDICSKVFVRAVVSRGRGVVLPRVPVISFGGDRCPDLSLRRVPRQPDPRIGPAYGLDRRGFLKGAFGAGAAVSMSSLLAACGGSSGGDTSSSGGGGTAKATGTVTVGSN